MSEKSFQNYFMKVVKDKNYYRTSLSNGTGYPDITADCGFIELKDLILGKKGDKKLRQCFEDSQPPWYAKYLSRGGKRLFVVFRIRDWDESNRRYGLWKLSSGSVSALADNSIYYADLVELCVYDEFKTLKELIDKLEEG